MLSWENRVTDNDGSYKIKLHGEDMDESSDQEYPEEDTSSEKKRYIHSNAEQVYR